MSKGYIVGRVDVLDEDRYRAYTRLAAAAIAAHGGKVLSIGRRVQALEGEARLHNVLLEFPTFEAACAYFDSAEYMVARNMRAGAVVIEMVAVEGRAGLANLNRSISGISA